MLQPTRQKLTQQPQHGEEQVTSLQSQLNSASQVAQAKARKLQQQLTEEQAEADSAADLTHISADCYDQPLVTTVR